MTVQKGNTNFYDQETFNGTAGCSGFAGGYSIYRGGQGRDCQRDGSGNGKRPDGVYRSQTGCRKQ